MLIQGTAEFVQSNKEHKEITTEEMQRKAVSGIQTGDFLMVLTQGIKTQKRKRQEE